MQRSISNAAWLLRGLLRNGLPLAVAASLSLGGLTQAQEDQSAIDSSKDQELSTAQAGLSELHLLEPLWESNVVHRESSVLLRDESGAAVARLAFPAQRIVRVATADGSRVWQISDDLRLRDDGVTLELADTGPIEVIEAAQLFPPRDAPMSYRHRVGDPETNLLYAPGRWFHDHNIEITYQRAEGGEEASPVERQRTETLRPIDDAIAAPLARCLAKLRSGEPLRIGISGDSISTGLDASALSNAAPNQGGYAELLVAQLEALSDSQITLVNRAVAGWSVANGVSDLPTLLAEQPDLIVIAYGMNDVGRRDPKWFRDQTALMLQKIHEHNEQIEVVLVATMLGNDQWVHTPREMFSEYRDQLSSLQSERVAFADLTEVWTTMLKRKHFLDLTGNGLNHPNDCGHRLYAQAILKLLAVSQ